MPGPRGAGLGGQGRGGRRWTKLQGLGLRPTQQRSVALSEAIKQGETEGEGVRKGRVCGFQGDAVTGGEDQGTAGVGGDGRDRDGRRWKARATDLDISDGIGTGGLCRYEPGRVGGQ